VKVLLAAMLIDARHPALEDREEALCRVDVGLSPVIKLASPFLFGMVDCFVAGEAPADRGIGTALVRH
jgi:hypothetical protein